MHIDINDGYYVGTKAQCEYYNNKVQNNIFGGRDFPKWSLVTHKYQDETQWAVGKHVDVVHSNMTHVQELPIDWYKPKPTRPTTNE